MELKKMARFRNRLVHLYGDVDALEIRRILESKLGDFDRCLSGLGAYINEQQLSGL